jgi:DNA-binding NtrC family response regulator
MPIASSFYGGPWASQPYPVPADAVLSSLPRLLLVGREERAVAPMRNHFHALGWQVDCAFELEEAEALLAFRYYAAVVTEMSQAGVDGPAGLKIVSRVRARCPRTSVFLLTGYYTTQLEADTRQAGGVDAFLPKSCPVEDLARVVCAAAEKVYA